MIPSVLWFAGLIGPGAAQESQPRAEPRKLELTVERCVELSLQNNPDLSALAFSAEASAFGIQQAEGGFDPLFSSSAQSGRGSSIFTVAGVPTSTATASRSAQAALSQLLYTGGSYSMAASASRTETFIDGGGTNASYSTALQLSITQPLLRGAWTTYNRAGILQAEMEKERAGRSFDDKVQQTINSVHAAYWDLVFTIQDLEVKRFALQLAQRLLEINEKKVEEGVSAPVEVLQAETEIALRREALITTENALKAAEDALRQLIFPFQRSEEWEFRIVPTSEAPSPETGQVPGWEEAIRIAMERRPDLERLRLDLRSRELSLESAANELLPKLNLNATRSNSGLVTDLPISESIEFTAGGDAPAYSVSLSLEVPLGNQSAKGKHRAAVASRDAARQALKSQENLAAREVRDAIRNLQFLKEKMAATTKSRELAEKQLEAEERKFEVGLSTNFQVLQLQQELVQALTNEKQARLSYAKALVNLKKVQGILQP